MHPGLAPVLGRQRSAPVAASSASTSAMPVATKQTPSSTAQPPPSAPVGSLLGCVPKDHTTWPRSRPRAETVPTASTA